VLPVISGSFIATDEFCEGDKVEFTTRITR
jgi:hypothetical protein